jgi:hypothetical protein
MAGAAGIQGFVARADGQHIICPKSDTQGPNGPDRVLAGPCAGRVVCGPGRVRAGLCAGQSGPGRAGPGSVDDELVDGPVLEGAVGQVPPDHKRDLALPPVDRAWLSSRLFCGDMARCRSRAKEM